MPPGHCRVDLRLGGAAAEDVIEGVAILSVVNHRVVVFEGRKVMCWSESAVYSDILSLVQSVALVGTVLVEGGLDEGVWQLDSDFSD